MRRAMHSRGASAVTAAQVARDMEDPFTAEAGGHGNRLQLQQHQAQFNTRLLEAAQDGGPPARPSRAADVYAATVDAALGGGERSHSARKACEHADVADVAVAVA